MKWFKDLFFGPGNRAADIARFAAAGNMGAFWTAEFTGRLSGDALAVGGGAAAIMGASAALIYYKDKGQADGATQ